MRDEYPQGSSDGVDRLVRVAALGTELALPARRRRGWGAATVGLAIVAGIAAFATSVEPSSEQKPPAVPVVSGDRAPFPPLATAPIPGKVRAGERSTRRRKSVAESRERTSHSTRTKPARRASPHR